MSDPDSAGMVRALYDQERAGARANVPIGVFAAYILSGAVEGALKAPDLGRAVVAVGEDVRGQIYAAYMTSPLGGLVSMLDAIRMGADQDAPPEPAYVRMVQALLTAEQEGARLYVTLGPFSSFALAALLQLATRHPLYEQYPGATELVTTFARQLQASFSDEYQRMIELGFDAQFDLDEAGGLPTVAQPRCPRCGQVPMLLVSGTQAFCANDDCDVFQWNPNESAAQFEAKARTIDLSPTRGEGEG